MPPQRQAAAIAGNREKETSRLEAFSDGVFAIAITLLALELKAPHFGTGGDMTAQLIAGLDGQWPGYFAFVTSFFTVLIMWVHHHAVFRLVHRVDATPLFANGFFLMLVTLVPFPTAVVAEYLRTPAARAACIFYAGFFVLISIGFSAPLWAAFRQSVLSPGASATRIESLRRSYRLGPPLYLAATVAGVYSPWLAMAICTALWIVWAATTREC
jgi:uncharacterized membrane protein